MKTNRTILKFSALVVLGLEGGVPTLLASIYGVHSVGDNVTSIIFPTILAGLSIMMGFAAIKTRPGEQEVQKRFGPNGGKNTVYSLAIKGRFFGGLRTILGENGYKVEDIAAIIEIPLNNYVAKQNALEQGILYMNNSGKIWTKKNSALYGVKFNNGDAAQVLVYGSLFKIGIRAHFFKEKRVQLDLNSWDSALDASSNNIRSLI